MDRAVHGIHRLELRQCLIGPRHRLRRQRRVHRNSCWHADRILDVFNAAQPAAHTPLEAALHHPVPVQMVLVNGQIDRQSFRRRKRENSFDMGGGADNPFGQREAHGEVIKIGGCGHHHRIGRGVEQDGNRHLLRHLPDNRLRSTGTIKGTVGLDATQRRQGVLLLCACFHPRGFPSPSASRIAGWRG